MGQPFNTKTLHQNPSTAQMSEMWHSGTDAFWQVNVTNRNFSSSTSTFPSTTRVNNNIPVIIGASGNYPQTIQTVPEQHTRKAQNQGTTKNSHIGHCTHTVGSAKVKVQNIYHI